MLLLACAAPEVEVASSEDLGPLPTSATIRARDGGYSARFDDRSVWLYGDTILSVVGEDGSSWRDNSWSWTDDLDPTDGIDGFAEPQDAAGAPRELFPETEAERAYNEAHRDVDRDGDGVSDCEAPCSAREVLWPKAVVPSEGADPAGALVFYVKIHGEPGAWNFWPLGGGVAWWPAVGEPLERPPSRPEAEDPTLAWDVEDLPGDAAFLHPDDGHVYAYACEGEDGLDKPCRLTRAPWTDALSAGAWAWYDGEGWGDVANAAELFQGQSQLSVYPLPFTGGYLAAYVDWGTMVLRTAPEPWGPWSAPVAAFDTLAPADGFTYCGMAHAEYAEDDGRVQYLSYYRSTGDWTGELRLVRVVLR